MNIHVVDDNESITQMLKKYFTLKGHACTVSNSGRNALTLIEDQKFDVILLDLAMPEFSGRDIVSHLVKSGKIKNTNIVVLTASSPSMDYEDELKEMGVHSILKKPIDPDSIMNHIQQFDKKAGGG
jgi:DNA-binding response OmpR family regulator